jgi:hypothetical protein
LARQLPLTLFQAAPNLAAQFLNGSCAADDVEHDNDKVDLLQIGWRKAAELVKVARSDKQRFQSAPWVHKAKNLPREEFRHEVEKYLTGKESEPSDLVYFKLYKSQMPVIEQALETAAFMLGSDKSRGYCLEMICADVLAGAHASGGDPAVLLEAVVHSYKLMPPEPANCFSTSDPRK